MNSVKLLGVAAGLILLSGCGALDIEALRSASAPTQGTAFTKALTSEYRSLAIFEADEMKDWPDAYTFAAKGLAASRGENVQPEELSQWALPPERTQELAAARAKLIKALEAGRTAKPAQAAQAQAAFDCWVEQEEEAFQLADIAGCRAVFDAALAQLATSTAAAAATPATTVPTLSSNFIIYFDWDSARLDAAALRIIDEAAAVAKAKGNTRITIVGHADRSGPPEYNLRLSLRRASAVRKALAAKGIANERTSLTALGETEPAVPTADGVREARNRRVELTIR